MPSGDCKRNIVARMGELRFCFTQLSNMPCCCTFSFALAAGFSFFFPVQHANTSVIEIIDFRKKMLNCLICVKLLAPPCTGIIGLGLDHDLRFLV